MQERTVPKAVNRYKTDHTSHFARIVVGVLFLVVVIFIASSFFNFRRLYQGVGSGIQNIFESMPAAEDEQPQEEYEQDNSAFDDTQQEIEDAQQAIIEPFGTPSDTDTASPAEPSGGSAESDESEGSDETPV